MANYKTTVLAESKVEWTASTGMQLCIAAQLQQQEIDYFMNGEYRPKGSPKIRLVSYANGAEQINAYTIEPVTGQGVLIARLGKIGLTAERLSEVKAAEAEVAKHPAWIALQSQIAQNNADARKYDAAQRRLNNMMTLNGRSY